MKAQDDTPIAAEEVALVPVRLHAEPARSVIRLEVTAEDGRTWRFLLDGIQAADLAADALHDCAARIEPRNA